MLQNCSKLPSTAATMPTPLLQMKMSTSSGDELKMGHFHCRNRLCMVTGTSIAVDELRHGIDHPAYVVAHNGRATTSLEFNELQCVGAPPRLHSRTAGPAQRTSTTLPTYCKWRITVVNQGNLHLRLSKEDDELQLRDLDCLLHD